jgi:hypothetical protein
MLDTVRYTEQHFVLGSVLALRSCHYTVLTFLYSTTDGDNLHRTLDTSNATLHTRQAHEISRNVRVLHVARQHAVADREDSN